MREFDSQDTLECVVCDGTSVMTGCYNGMVASAERELGGEGGDLVHLSATWS